MSRIIRYGGPRPQDAGETPGTDGYLSKLAKYVPAEVIAATSIVFAAFTFTGLGLWVAIAVAAVANIFYLFVVAAKTPGQAKPPSYFYLLSALAFFSWAAATIEAVTVAVGITGDQAAAQKAAILAAAAFVIPLLDEGFTYVKARKRVRQHP